MKKLLQSLPQVLVNLCVSYTCAVLLYTLLDAQQATMRRAWLYEILAICAAATVLQYVFFSGESRKAPLLPGAHGLVCSGHAGGGLRGGGGVPNRYTYTAGQLAVACGDFPGGVCGHHPGV